MINRISAEEVAQQFAKSIRMLLEWIEQRDQGKRKDLSRSNIEEYGRKELLKAADAAKILNISKSMTYQMMQRGEIPTVRIGGSVRVRMIDLDEYIKNSLG